MKGADGTLYEGENFTLQFKFSSKYPFDSPEVTIFLFNNPGCTSLPQTKEPFSKNELASLPFPMCVGLAPFLSSPLLLHG